MKKRIQTPQSISSETAQAEHPEDDRTLRDRKTERGLLPIVVASLVVVAAVSLGAGYCVGNLQGEKRATNESRDEFRDRALQSVLAGLSSHGEIPLHAATATSNQSFAIATGPIDSDVEGLYVLDFVTGDLHCTVLNFRTGKFSAVFRANVAQDLGSEGAGGKSPGYLISTGMINFPRGASVARPGNCICYVLDTLSGAYAAYAIPWRRELAATGRPQGGAMMLLDVGRARTLEIRE